MRWREATWLIPLSMLTALQFSAAKAATRYSGQFPELPVAQCIDIFATLAGLTLSGLFVVSIGVLMWRGEPHPLRRYSDAAKANADLFLVIPICTLCVGIFFSSFSTLKALIPVLDPFWADPLLANVDRTIFGVDAWRIAHLIGSPALSTALIWTYTSWSALNLFILVWALVSTDRVFKARLLLSYFLCWLLLGVVLATLFSSVGPIFYDETYGGHRFAGLAASLPHDGPFAQAVAYLRASLHLRSKTALLGGGISAMPSLHVGTAVLFALAVRQAAPKVFPIMLFYAAVIMFASVYLGWHFVSDGVVATGGTIAIWWMVGRALAAVMQRSPSVQPVPALPLDNAVGDQLAAAPLEMTGTVITTAGPGARSKIRL